MRRGSTEPRPSSRMPKKTSPSLLTAQDLRALESEKEFQERVIYAARLHRWKVYAIPDSRRATIAGYPDLTMWRGARLLFVELKREKGKLSPAQVTVLDELRLLESAEVYVWRPSDWDSLVNILSSAG